MSDTEKTLTVRFYQTTSGNEPVRAWLQSLSRADRLVVGKDVKTVEYGWPIGMPTCRPLGDGLWEVRSNLSDKRIARVLFCITDDTMVLVHGFVKKSQQTPQNDMHLARQRMKEVLA